MLDRTLLHSPSYNVMDFSWPQLFCTRFGGCCVIGHLAFEPGTVWVE